MKSRIAGLLLACFSVVALAAATEDEITFDKNKGKLYATFAQELKKDPTLKGRVKLEIVIATSGQVDKCRVLYSEAKTPEFGNKLCERIRQIQFAARPAPKTIVKNMDFFPAT